MGAPNDAESQLYLPELAATRAASDPRRVFLHDADSGQAFTYADTEVEVRRWAARLRGAGVASGDTVLVMLPTGSVAAFVWLAVARLRAIEAPVNLDYRGRLLAHVAINSRAKVAVVASRSVDHLLSVPEPSPTLRTVIVVGSHENAENPTSARLVTPESLDRSPVATGEEDQWPQDHDVASLFYTSGTTGPSKGVLVTWKQIDRIARWYFPPGSLQSHETVYAPFPMFHLSGKVLIMIAAITDGSVVLRERFKTDRYWADVHQFGATSTMLLGSMPDFVLDAPGFSGRSTSTLEKIVMNPLIQKLPEFVEKFGVRVCGLYGSTEVGIPIATGWDRNPAGTCGRACPDFELRIVDKYDREVPDGTAGELVVRTTEPWLLMSGYWAMPEATVAAWRNLWFHTGDIMRRDAEGNYFFVDRIKDMIRRRGENISSMELEREVLDHPDVLDCAVVGVRGEWTEEEVLLAVTRKPGSNVTEPGLAEFLVDRVAPFMVPRFFWFTDELPRTETGKVRKQLIRESPVPSAAWDRGTRA
jgi:crotonobetaine/carnitine-CoA ligase